MLCSFFLYQSLLQSFGNRVVLSAWVRLNLKTVFASYRDSHVDNDNDNDNDNENTFIAKVVQRKSAKHTSIQVHNST